MKSNQMRICTLLAVAAFSFVTGWSQDQNIEDLISKVEGDQTGAEQSFEELVKTRSSYTPKNAEETAVLKVAIAYWQSNLNRDTRGVYDHFWDGYRDVVSFTDYMKQERATVSDYHIESVEILGETCAQVNAYHTVEHPMMTVKRVYARHRWYLSDGEWRLIADPFVNIMGFTPKHSNKITIPCQDEKTVVSN